MTQPNEEAFQDRPPTGWPAAESGQGFSDDRAADPEEERLGALINEFFDRRESGEDITEAGFLAEHAEHAEALREHFCGLGLLSGLGSSSGRRTVSRDQPVIAPGSSGDAVEAVPGQALPDVAGYQILKQIGRGGMGVVFKAVQLSTKRVVALKLLLEGPFASEVTRRRFEREITLAAQLRHSNIIPIYDSGIADGRMFYAMEYVHGLPLNDYLRGHSVDLKDKLRLFAKVCGAITHAHVRGVVHRDLKPSNILVDAEGEPHVLDFGLAKTGILSDATTSMTAQIVGTPAYMSPEQAAGDPSGVDIRTDVYSLGMVLYEALTGGMPYETTGAIGRILNSITNAEPVPPDKIDRRIDAELSAIVLKALEKSKEDRYQSLDALGGDIRHYLAGEPVSARPPSGFYLLRKAMYKYRLPVGVAAVLVICVCSMLIMLHFIRTSRAEAEMAKRESRQLQKEVTQKEAARLEAEEGRLAAEAGQREAEAARREYEWLVKNVDPEFGKKLDPFARALGKSVAEGQDATVAAARLAAQLLSEVELRTPPGPTKNFDSGVDPNAPLLSARPSWVQEKPKTESAEPLDLKKKMLEALLRRIEASAASAATSQPASAPAATSARHESSPQAAAHSSPPAG
jgi:predicted Ser/Thr protein kinase